MTETITAREAAARALFAIREDDAWSAPVLRKYTAQLSPRDAALATALTGGVLNAKTLAALSMGAAGLRSLSRCGWGVPGAMTLLWWAASLFGRNTTP